MNETLLISLIAAGSACLGALIPSLFSFLSLRIQFKNEKKLKNSDKQTEEYVAYIEAMQYMMNNPFDPNGFIVFQQHVNKVLLFSEKKTAELISEYYHTMIELQQQNKGLTPENHKKFQNDIINSMREDLLGVSSKKADKLYLIAFRP